MVIIVLCTKVMLTVNGSVVGMYQCIVRIDVVSPVNCRNMHAFML